MNLRIATLCLMAAAGASVAPASEFYNLADDFSNVDNPNGAWSFRAGTSNLAHYTDTTRNAITAAFADGYWGLSSTSYVNSVMKATALAGNASGYQNLDWGTGSVVTNTNDFGSSSPLFIVWTAPATGTIGQSGSVWYANGSITRSQDYSIMLNGETLASGTVTNGKTRKSPSRFFNAGPIGVQAGDELALELTPSVGSDSGFGSLSGVTWNIAFDPLDEPVPEPGTWFVVTALAPFFLWMNFRHEHLLQNPPHRPARRLNR